MAERLSQWVHWAVRDVTVDLKAPPGRYLPGDEYNDLIGQRIKNVYRRGKFIAFELTSKWLVCHNAMSGFWDTRHEPWTFDYVEGKREATEKDVRVVLRLEPGWGVDRPAQDDFYLRFHDARKFGSLRLYDKLDLGRVGPESLKTRRMLPNAAVADTEHYVNVIRSSKLPIKAVLLDQAKLAGVGNIYAAESLWLAKIDPQKPANQLSSADAEILHFAVEGVLRAAINRSLNYNSLSVYRRSTCPDCNQKISVTEIKGRSTYHCSRCQT
jgi:formamidopyrimidine-DNA glycosylase